MGAYHDKVLSYSPAFYYRLNEPSGSGTATNEGSMNLGTTNHFEGTQVNSLLAGEPDDRDRSYDGTDDETQSGVNSALITNPRDVWQQLSFLVWHKLNAPITNTIGVAEVGSSGTDLYGIKRRTSHFFFFIGGDATAEAQAPVSASDLSVFFLVGTWKASAVGGDGLNRLYVNGMLAGTSEASPSWPSNPSPFVMIGNTPFSQFGNEIVGEVALLPVALTSAQISELYTLGTTPPPPPPPPTVRRSIGLFGLRTGVF